MNIRTTKPSNNKFYITKSKGGYSECIQGNPTDPNANVLANCVGYACGRFNEIIGEMRYPKFNCNAENFIERAKNYGLEISSKPTLGGIMVWEGKGSLAGHVAIVERIDSSNQIYTSESAYGGSYFFNATRKNDNGRWGLSSKYSFRGCIVNPEIKDETKYVYNCDSLNVRKGAGTKYALVNDLYCGTEVTVSEIVDGWAKIGEGQWVANNYLTKNKPLKVYHTKVVTASDGLNVRTSNRFWGSNLAKTKTPLKKGTIVSVVKESGSGTQIGDKRWVYTKYLK